MLGTGDLSELALGWCTYGVGDQMSHYAVNTGVPKTLMQHLIRWVVTSRQFDHRVGEILTSILDTEISPELVPSKVGEKPQSTEDSASDAPCIVIPAPSPSFPRRRESTTATEPPGFPPARE